MFIQVKNPDHKFTQINPKFVKAMFIDEIKDEPYVIWVMDCHYAKHELDLDHYGLSEESRKDAKTIVELMTLLQEDC